MPICPAGHDSGTGDYCDVCGALLTGTRPRSGPAPATPDEATGPDRATPPCLACGTPRSGRFCEACGYDSVTSTGGTAFRQGFPDATASAPDVGEGDPLAPWTAVVTADRAYFEGVAAVDGPDAATITFPPYCPERRFPLTGQQVRIGRRGTSPGSAPEIDLSGPPRDPGVSHLHAVLLAQPDGSWQLVDPGSTNGTTLNDDPDPLPINEGVPMADGDRIHIGAWTTITIKRRQQ
jgi:hypothetical protein